MSWMQKLCATYEHCYGNSAFAVGEHRLEPVCHISQNVQIKVILDPEGNFNGAELLGKTPMVIPATEDSASRSGICPPPHPLIDKIRYCAGDYASHGGQKKDFFALYEDLLRRWTTSEHSHPKVRAVHAYVLKKCLVSDLAAAGIVFLDDEGKLSRKPRDEKNPGLFKYLADDKDQGDALVCWSVEGLGGPDAATWTDPDLRRAWISYEMQQISRKAFCMITGEEKLVIAKHPRNIRRSGDNAKLISSDDDAGFTFRGKFDQPEEACTVGYESSHQAHNALRWLIARQGSRQGDQAVLAWAVLGEDVPSPVEEEAWQEQLPQGAFIPSVEEEGEEAALSHAPDMGQRFSMALGKALHGFDAKFKPTDEIVILGLDSATPGRLSVVFYRELIWADYLRALKAWQGDCAWVLRKSATQEEEGKKKKRIFWRCCAPLPVEIALAAYGQRADDKLKAAIRERLLPCIADRRALPADIVENAVRRACSRHSLDGWEWETTLGVACALYRGFNARRPEAEKRRSYAMTLEKDRITRDYLYGRLLAVAEHVEKRALFVAKETRPTNAERLMQRFADRPCSTWKVLREALQPYRQRLLQTRGGFLHAMDALLDEIADAFVAKDFVSDERLTGEYLLGYHCQRQDLRAKKSSATPDDNETMEGEE